MTGFAVFALSAVVVVSLVMFTLYRKFGTGLATRLIGMLVGGTVLAAGLEFYVGSTGGDLKTHLLIVLVFAPVVMSIYVGATRYVVTRMDALSEALVRTASKLSTTAERTAASAAHQTATVAQVGAAVRELSETSKATARSASLVEADGDAALEHGRHGAEALSEARDVLAVLERIQQIANVVNALADQSSYLAVNAGIEAAKAGEEGRGFAVVAREVRALAEQSKRAAAQIQTALESAHDGRDSLRAVNDVVEGLSAVLDESAERGRHISAAANQQAAGIDQIAHAMEGMDVASRSVETAAEQIREVVARLDARAQQTRRLITAKTA